MSSQESRSPYEVLVYGPHLLQNELICSFIREGTKYSCTIIDSFSALASPSVEVKARLLLIDCSGQQIDQLTLNLHKEYPLQSPPLLWALFNLEKAATIEAVALQQGIRGFFYDTDPSCLLVKGITAIFQGELWMPRKKMEEFILTNRPLTPRPGVKIAELTDREREILTLVATGANNELIASQLCISPHTVKTHIYNIFKKIDVSNRLEAAIWASNQGLADLPSLKGADV